jgi:hypothetical protein
MLQTGCSHKEKDCRALKCVFDSRAALITANFYFMEAVIRQYPHILTKIHLPDNYTAIVLSSIVNTPDSAPVTTELSVGFNIHLPYYTMDSNGTSLLIPSGPDVAVILVLGLPFIKEMGMVAEFVDNVCKAKNLLCDPFPINFKHATKSIPVFQSKPEDSLFLGKHVSSALQILGMLKSFMSGTKMVDCPISFGQRQGMVQILANVQLKPPGISSVPGWSASIIVGLPLPLKQMALAIMNIRSWEILGICKFHFQLTLTRSHL